MGKEIWAKHISTVPNHLEEIFRARVSRLFWPRSMIREKRAARKKGEGAQLGTDNSSLHRSRNEDKEEGEFYKPALAGLVPRRERREEGYWNGDKRNRKSLVPGEIG